MSAPTGEERTVTTVADVCWVVWCRDSFEPDGGWFPWFDTARYTRADSIGAADWLGPGEYKRKRKCGVLKCVRTSMRARLP